MQFWECCVHLHISHRQQESTQLERSVQVPRRLRRHTVTVQGELDTIGAPPARICTTFLTGDICPTAEILRLGDKAQTVWLASIDHSVFTTHAEFVCVICGATRLVAQISSRSAI